VTGPALRSHEVPNEKHMIERAGLDDVNGLMTGASSDPADPVACVDAVAAVIRP
jgi:hypothetical protein